MPKQPVEIARTMIEEVYGQGKVNLIAQNVDDEFTEHNPMTGNIRRDGLESSVQMWRTAFPDLRMEMLDCVASGEKVTARWRATGTHKGELMGSPPTNKKATVEGMSMMVFRNGKVAESWIQFDGYGLLRQLGLVPDLGKSAPRRDGGRATAPQTPRR